MESQEKKRRSHAEHFTPHYFDDPPALPCMTLGTHCRGIQLTKDSIKNNNLENPPIGGIQKITIFQASFPDRRFWIC